MTSVTAAMTAITDRLNAAGIRAVVDERDVNPPCALLRPPALAYRFNKGGWTASWSLWAIVPDGGRRTATEALDVLMGDIQTALGGAVVTALPINVTGIDGQPALPGYDMSWQDTIR